jgi:hypothetical protein
MHAKYNGYVSGAVLLLPFVKKVREHVEFEKFMARVEVDNEETRNFKKTTEVLKDQRYNLRYNNVNADKLTKFGRKNGNQ